MSLRKWKNKFSKKEFVQVIKAVAIKCMDCFNYTRNPYIVEKTLPNSTLMRCYSSGKYTIIAYDYVKFKRNLRDFSYEEQYIFTAQTMAHEMRHYYQHRQIMAKQPIENEKTIDFWVKNSIVKTRGMKKTNNYEYFFSSAELDAVLFAHIFTLDHLESVCLMPICNRTHFKALKKLYKQKGGKNIQKYFPNKMKRFV